MNQTLTENMEPETSALSTVCRTGSGGWFFNWSCGVCMDSGIVKTETGPEQCTSCLAFLNPISQRVFGAISVLLFKQKPIDDLLFNMARALVSMTSDSPMPGDALVSLLLRGARDVKETAKRLRDEWHLPVIGSRNNPKGYFIAASAEQFLEWGRVTRSQAISELATYYNLFKANFPELAGQQPLDFVDNVSTELKEAIR